jgi:hypothetical protein
MLSSVGAGFAALWTPFKISYDLSEEGDAENVNKYVYA